MPTLAHALIAPQGETPTQWMFFVHGIMGQGTNFRGLAKRWVATRLARGQRWGAILVDLREHGHSMGFAPPHTVAACAEDLLALESSLGLRIRGAIGHSFGGKVALAWMAARAQTPDELWTLDSNPGGRVDAHGSETTLHVLTVLHGAPRRFTARADFMSYALGAGLSPMIAEWLAMNVVPTPEGDFRFRLDLDVIHALLDDYFRQDLWPVVEQAPQACRMHLVVGGRSTVYDSGDYARAVRVAAVSAGRVSVHVLEHAAHWVHVDAPDKLLTLLG